MNNIYKERITEIRALMKEQGLDMYYIPMDDCHNSEYVGEYFKTIEFVSGFTGSAARMIITPEEAYLWTDGRYFLQAGMELEGSDIILMKMGQEGVPKLEDFVNRLMEGGAVLGFDGNVVNTEFAEKVGSQIRYDMDLAGQVWKDRPEQKFSKLRLFEPYAGETAAHKLERLRSRLKDCLDKHEEYEGKDYLHIINSLDDIAWLFNFRADDIPYNPVAYAYAAVSRNKAVLYCGDDVADEAMKEHLRASGVELGSYRKLQEQLLLTLREDFPGLETKTPVLLDPSRISCGMYRAFTDHEFPVINISNPTGPMKAVKNETEISNTRKAQIKDGVALVQCMKWIKENAGKERISECDVSDKLVEYRSMQEGFIEPSFATIAGYASNAAIIHYEPERGSDALIRAEGMLLVDSGGHYLEGTTDTTRTFVLGPVTEEEKKCFTLVAASMLRLLNFNERKAEDAFNGLACDKETRKLLIENGYNYNHGTGHGIGHVLNVHEDPPVISGSRAAHIAEEPFVPGMITSDEPGVYVDGSFGIRTENDMLVVEKEDENGRWLAFENLTFVPIDIDGIDKKYLTDEDAERLNAFNKNVYDTLSPLLDEETASWLKQYTQPV